MKKIVLGSVSLPGDFDGEQTLGLTLVYQCSKKHAYVSAVRISIGYRL